MPRPPRPRKKTVVRYATPDGKRCRKGDPGATATRTQTATWYAHLGGAWVSLETTDEGEAWQVLRRLLRRREQRAAGITDTTTDAARRPLAEHVEDWLAVLQAQGAGAKRAGTLRTRVLALAAAAGWMRLSDITPDTCLIGLARLVEREGLSAQTRNHYLGHAKQFCRWAASPPARLQTHPLIALRRIAVDADRRHERRCPTDEEVCELFACLAGHDVPVRAKMTGAQRALGYKVAMAAGLRAGELRSLSRESFDLDGATVAVRAAYDKRRRKVLQPLPAWLVVELRAWFAGSGGCWQTLPVSHAASRILKPDLEAAGVAYTTPGPDGPLFFDLHALRVWYVTQLANQPGISPKTLMALSRHASADLSLKVYGKAKQEETRAAAQALPDPLAPKRSREP